MLGKRMLVARAIDFSGGGRLLRRFGTWSGVVALAYHRVTDGREDIYDPGVWSALADDFEQQVRFLKRNFDLIRPCDVEQCLRKQYGRYALVTFDDGYRDNYECAFPILRDHSVPGVFFVSTGFIDWPRIAWWDEIAWMVSHATVPSIAPNRWLEKSVAFGASHADEALRTLLLRYKKLEGAATGDYMEFLGERLGSGRFAGDCRSTWMTWDMLREMHRAGMCIEGHTANHPILARLTAEEQLAELAECKSRIESELKTRIDCISYPVGGRDAFNADTRSCLAQLNIPMAFSYYGGYLQSAEFDRYDVPRVSVERDTSTEMFHAMMTLPQLFC